MPANPAAVDQYRPEGPPTTNPAPFDVSAASAASATTLEALIVSNLQVDGWISLRDTHAEEATTDAELELVKLLEPAGVDEAGPSQ